MPVYKDGTPVTGSQILTINTVTYIADDLTESEGSNKVVEYDKDGIPKRQVFFPEVPTLSGTLQCAATATVKPPVQTDFTIATGDHAGKWILETVGVTTGNRAIKKFTFSASKSVSA